MENIRDVVDWIVWILVAVVGWFLNRTINKIEQRQDKLESKLNDAERDIAVIGKSVDNNFSTLSSSIDDMKTQMSEIKALLIEELKKDKK